FDQAFEVIGNVLINGTPPTLLINWDNSYYRSPDNSISATITFDITTNWGVGVTWSPYKIKLIDSLGGEQSQDVVSLPLNGSTRTFTFNNVNLSNSVSQPVTITVYRN